MTPRDLFLRALHRQPTPRPATGSATSVVTMDLMDKVGVSFPDAHLDPEKMAALAAAGHTEIGFDNVMPLFSVWHESAALGCQVNWGEKDRMPDCSDPLCATLSDPITIPADLLKRPPCAVPLKALRLLRKRFDNDVAVVGKVFGPWTLGYHVFGVEDFLVATLTEPEAVRKAMRTLMKVTIAFGKAQLDAGADALCLADHCTRDLCAPQAYRDFLAEIHQEIHECLRCPLILHICGDTSDRIPFIPATGVECFHFDSKVPAARARELAGSSLALMGGTSNLTVIQSGTPESILADVREKIANRIDIIGPECAVPLNAPYRNLQQLAAAVKRRG
jgi:[methyl-Co(III) methanol-specific corrinoid protein]:coenzyme M methyltransferase